jgi:1,4-alpha-glucan branching enzyme
MATKNKRVEFRIHAPGARQVLLSGTFNKWSETSDPMKKAEAGVWKKVKVLPAGRYEYKFIVDGEWTIDPLCSDTSPNGHGARNSVIELP